MKSYSPVNEVCLGAAGRQATADDVRPPLSHSVDVETCLRRGFFPSLSRHLSSPLSLWVYCHVAHRVFPTL